MSWILTFIWTVPKYKCRVIACYDIDCVVYAYFDAMIIYIFQEICLSLIQLYLAGF